MLEALRGEQHLRHGSAEFLDQAVVAGGQPLLQRIALHRQLEREVAGQAGILDAGHHAFEWLLVPYPAREAHDGQHAESERGAAHGLMEQGNSLVAALIFMNKETAFTVPLFDEFMRRAMVMPEVGL